MKNEEQSNLYKEYISKRESLNHYYFLISKSKIIENHQNIGNYRKYINVLQDQIHELKKKIKFSNRKYQIDNSSSDLSLVIRELRSTCRKLDEDNDIIFGYIIKGDRIIVGYTTRGLWRDNKNLITSKMNKEDKKKIRRLLVTNRIVPRTDELFISPSGIENYEDLYSKFRYSLRDYYNDIEINKYIFEYLNKVIYFNVTSDDNLHFKIVYVLKDFWDKYKKITDLEYCIIYEELEDFICRVLGGLFLFGSVNSMSVTSCSRVNLIDKISKINYINTKFKEDLV